MARRNTDRSTEAPNSRRRRRLPVLLSDDESKQHTRNTLGILLRNERLSRDEKQIEAAARFGISQPSYWKWESGRGFPDDDKFAAVAQYLGINVDDVWELVNGDAEMPTSHDDLSFEVAALRRVVDDLQDQIRALTERIDGLAQSQ